MKLEQFLMMVRAYIESDPEAAAHVADYVQAGLRVALDETRERAADMEVALAVLAAKRYKGANALVCDKLAKWNGKTAMRWDWFTHNAAVQARGEAQSPGTGCYVAPEPKQ